MQISQEHPLQRLFHELVREQFSRRAHVYDADIAEYVTRVLVDFADVEHLYRIHNAQGRPLEDVAEMLIESNPLLDAPSFDREREVRKHVGDFTLFFAGFFPELVASLPRVRWPSLDAVIDYVKAGKESYAVVAAFNLFEYRAEAPLFRRLSEQFEQCVFGLNLVKHEIEELQGGSDPRFRPDFGVEG
jgi:hypothetical protein